MEFEDAVFEEQQDIYDKFSNNGATKKPNSENDKTRDLSITVKHTMSKID